MSPHPCTRRDFLRSTGIAGIVLSAGAPFSPLRAQTPGGRIRIGQIGTVHAHAGGKMEAIRKSQEFEVVGVVEPDPARRAAAEKSRSFAGLRWMTEEELLSARGLAAVAVETAVKDLVPTAARCVAAGMHVHLDKPAGESLRAFKALLDEAGARKLTVQMGYMLRYNPAFQLCVQLVRDGTLGEVFSVDASMSKVIGAPERAKLLAYRGGAMFELGCHVIDAVISVLGRPGKVTAYNRSSSPFADGLADNQLAVLEYPKATAVVRSALVEIDGGARRQFAVCGAKGTLDIRPIEPPEARLTLDAPHGDYKKGWQTPAFPKSAGRYDGEFADLAKVIRGETEFAFSREHDLATHETILLASGLPIA